MKPIELIHGEIKIKMLFVNLTTMNVLRDLGIEPTGAVEGLKNLSSDKLGLMNLLKTIIYNGMKVYCEDYDKTIPYKRSEILDIIIKDVKEEESNLGNMLMLFIESISGKTSEEILKLVDEEEKKMTGSDGTGSSSSTVENLK